MNYPTLNFDSRFKRILLAVSGGIDSVCLAHYFIAHRQLLKIEWIGIAHIHHGLREFTADRDEAFVQKLARDFNVPFFVRYLDGNALKASGSVEENARLARYQALHEIAALPKVKADCIMTAHHANDQAETVLIRIKRGCTLKGLCGIQPNREDGILRPLLHWRKADIWQYMADYHLQHVEDETNADTAFERNALRHKTLPAIERENESAIRQLSSIAEHAASSYKKIISTVDATVKPYIVPQKLWPFSAAFLPYEKVFVIHQKALDALSAKSVAGGAEMFRYWLKEKGFDFPAGTDFRSNFSTRDGELIFEKSRALLWFCQNKTMRPMPTGFRVRKDGDICIIANRSAKKLKKFFEEVGVPPFARNSIPVRNKADGSIEIYPSAIR